MRSLLFLVTVECHSPTTWVSKKGRGYRTAHVKQLPLEAGWFKFVWNEKLPVTWNPSLLTLWQNITITSSQVIFLPFFNFFFSVGRKAHWWKLAQFFLFKLSGRTTKKNGSHLIGNWAWPRCVPHGVNLGCTPHSGFELCLCVDTRPQSRPCGKAALCYPLSQSSVTAAF